MSALKKGEIVIGNVQTPKSNPYWDQIYGPGRAATVIWTIWGVGTLFLAIYKLRQFIMAVGFRPKTLPQMSLLLEMLASISTREMRFFYVNFLVRILAVSDLGAKNVFSTQDVIAFLITHEFTIVTISLLTTFYWQTALHRAGVNLFNCTGCILFTQQH